MDPARETTPHLASASVIPYVLIATANAPTLKNTGVVGKPGGSMNGPFPKGPPWDNRTSKRRRKSAVPDEYSTYKRYRRH